MAVGAFAVERDYSHYVSYASKTILAVVGTASKGPIGEATLVTSTQDLVNKFGPLKTDCFGLYASQYFLSQASKLYFIRAASESAAGAGVIIAGVDADDQNVADGVTITMREKGTFSNNYKVTISAGTPVDTIATYNITLKNDKGTVLETLSNKRLSDITTSLTGNYMSVTAVSLSAVSLVLGDYLFGSSPSLEGDDGITDIAASDYISAAANIEADTVDVNLLAIPGVSDPEVITNVLAKAEAKGDFLYIIDPPKGLTTSGIIEWVNGTGILYDTVFNSSYGAVYYDWINIYDSVNKVQVQVPPSVVVCATYAYSDRVSDLWYAPAGLTRGLVRGALTTVSKLSKASVEVLYENNINTIYEDPQVGLVLWGQKTIYKEDTALDRINVRRLMNYLKRIITAACNYLIFEPNDRITWNSFEMKVIPALDSIKNRRGIYEYSIIKGETIVTDDDIDNYRMPCMIMIRPTKAAEEIPIYFVITSTGADFNEVLESNGVVTN